jgi:hypothetical protein
MIGLIPSAQPFRCEFRTTFSARLPPSHPAQLAEKQRLPSMFIWRQYAEAGGLMSYGVDLRDTRRRAPEDREGARSHHPANAAGGPGNRVGAQLIREEDSRPHGEGRGQQAKTGTGWERTP